MSERWLTRVQDILPSLALGIAGMASAIGLANTGWQVTIFGPHPKPLQGGLQLAPNGLQALSDLQLLDACRPSLTPLDAIEIRSVRLQKILASIDHRTPVKRDYGSFHRGTLLDIFTTRAAEMPLIHHDTRMVAACEEDKDALTLICADATTSRFDLVIGADGKDGLWRSLILGKSRLAPHLMSPCASSCHLPPLFTVPRTQLWFGDGYHLVHYPLQQGTLVNLVLCMALPRQEADTAQQPDGHPYQSALTRQMSDGLKPRYPWPKPYRSGARGGLRYWVMRPISCHRIWQGAGQTLEDAASLSKAMAQVTAQKGDAVTALSEWAIQRARMVAPIVKRAEQTGKIMRLSGPLARLRNMAIDIADKALLRHGFNKSGNQSLIAIEDTSSLIRVFFTIGLSCSFVFSASY